MFQHLKKELLRNFQLTVFTFSLVTQKIKRNKLFLFYRAFKRILCCQRHWGSSPRSTANHDTFRSSIDHTMPNSNRCLDMNPNPKSHKYIFKLNFIETCWKRTSVSYLYKKAKKS